MDPSRRHPLNRRSSKFHWLKRAPHKDPLKLRTICMSQVSTSLINALHWKGVDISKDFHEMCEMVKTTLPVDLRTMLVQDLAATQVIGNECIFMRLLLLHILADVQHISLITKAAPDNQFCLSEKECNQLLDELGSTSTFSLLSLRIEGVTFVKGVLSEIIHRSTKVLSIHVSGDEAAREVLSSLAKNPRRLHSLHLDNCTVNDLDVIHALVKSYNETDSWMDMDITGMGTTSKDHDCPPLCHLSIQSPLVSVCGAVVLLHSLRNLETLQYSHWNSSICNLLQYLQMKDPNAPPFALTCISLWRVTEKSLSTLKLCPNLQHLMMECTDPALTSMDSLGKLKKLNSLTLRLLPEDLLVSAVRTVGKKLLCLEVEYEEYAKTPIKWDTVKSLRKCCPNLRRLEMHHIDIVAGSCNLLAPLFSTSFVDLEHLNLSNVVIHPTLFSRLLFKNTSLKCMVLDINKEALVDSAFIKMAKSNNFSQLSELYLSAGMLSTRGIIYYMTLPSLNRISIQISNFPLITPENFKSLQTQIANGNYKCEVECITNDS